VNPSRANFAAATFETAQRQFRGGRKAEAYELCAAIVAREPGYLPALLLLGQVDMQNRRYERALPWLRRAVPLSPDNATLHYLLGVACDRLELHDEAAAALHRATQLKPDFAAAFHELGFSLLARRSFAAAAGWLARAAELAPDNSDYQRVLGGALLRLERAPEAIGALERALALSPASAEVMRNLALAYSGVGRLEDAERLAQRAVSMTPVTVEGYLALASVSVRLQKYDDALELLNNAAALDGASDLAQYDIGGIMNRLGRVSEAIAAFRRAAALAPADWAHVPRSAVAQAAGFDPEYDDERIAAEAKEWARIHALPLKAKRLPHPHDRSPERRLRVGYVSPDFRAHCQTWFTLPLFRNHDREQFEIVCYSSVAQPDRFTETLRACAHEWHHVGTLDAAALAQKIRGDRIDISVDLTMHMAHGRLLTFAEKPAPVQICWLAYPGTTGVDAIDYRISDPHLDPPDAVLPYSERTLRLPTFWCYDPIAEEPRVAPLPATLAGHVTFGSLNNFTKVNRGVLELWARVLRAVPDSKFLLLAPAGSARRFVESELERNGVAAARIEYVDFQPRGDYLRTFDRIDIGLDCLPANGHTTTLDSCWMGVPVVTLVGPTVLGRGGLSINRNLDLPEFIAYRPEEFVDIAVAWSRDLGRLGELRQGLRERMRASPLMDAPRFARDFEGALRGAWREWCATEDARTSGVATARD
jgi:protein O-GlcNAc transferase